MGGIFCWQSRIQVRTPEAISRWFAKANLPIAYCPLPFILLYGVCPFPSRKFP